ncbi:Cytochrome P450 6B2 [Eumeta japonica]|uniref:unspecific monooxygenase n=1 Tax=Eumeta variegata TaxID=151549 RepID=A0A4C2A382_EUMVA|nr:Cytochrome P450 6B2 [Eumeta japonica]
MTKLFLLFSYISVTAGRKRQCASSAQKYVNMNYYVVSVFLIIAYTIYFWLKKKYSYWSDKGVPGPSPLPAVGNFGEVFAQKKSPGQLVAHFYRQYPDAKYIGVYQGTRPILILRDPELVKHVMIKDFSHFQDRGVSLSNGEIEKNLFALEGNAWRVLRHRLTPIFTTGKLKTMVPLILKSMDKLLDYTDKIVEKNVDHEIRSLASKYTLDAIGSCAFGVEMDAFSEEENVYRKVANRIFTIDLETRVYQFINALFPGIIKKLGLKLKRGNLHEFFLIMVNQILKERMGKPKIRKDFMDFMIELKEEGHITRKGDDSTAELDITDVIMAAQAFVFYAAGFETSSATMSFLIHEISHNYDIQDRLYKEISTAINKHGGITYEALNDMPYLEMVLDETLRKYPVVGVLLRKCGAEYRLPDTKIILRKGDLVMISAYGLHYDPKYYPNPEEFNPERFSPENKSKLPSCVYLPFGDGPRNCIGMRFAKVQSMIGIAGFLNKFKVETSPKAKKVLEIDPKSITLMSKDGNSVATLLSYKHKSTMPKFYTAKSVDHASRNSQDNVVKHKLLNKEKLPNSFWTKGCHVKERLMAAPRSFSAASQTGRHFPTIRSWRLENIY